jgi:hypothetical protein
MTFTKRLRQRVMDGDITVSVRIWQKPRVRVGGRYPLGAGHIEVTAMTQIDASDITEDLARRGGFDDLDDMMSIARHGPGENVYLVEFFWQADNVGQTVDDLWRD